METLITVIEEAINLQQRVADSYQSDVERYEGYKAEALNKKARLEQEYTELVEKLGLNTLKEVA